MKKTLFELIGETTLWDIIITEAQFIVFSIAALAVIYLFFNYKG